MRDARKTDTALQRAFSKVLLGPHRYVIKKAVQNAAGLLRDKAVLLVTNQLQYAPEADHVLYLGERWWHVASMTMWFRMTALPRF